MSGSYPTTVRSVIGSIAQGMGNDPQHYEFQEKEDMLSLMSGNWNPLQQVHPTLKDYLLQEILKGDTSNARLEKLADEIVESMKDTFNEKNLPEEVKVRIRPGYEITSISLHTMRKHVAKLLVVILSTLPPTSSNPYPFSVAVKSWTVSFVDELVTMLSQALNGGITDAAYVIKYFLQERLSFMGPEFSQMGTNMVTSYIMNTYSNSQAEENLKDPQNWSKVIALDEIRQKTITPQPPFSDVYLSGASSKRRKTARLVNTQPQSLFGERMKEAIKNSNAVPKDHHQMNIEEDSKATNLSSKYLAQLSTDISGRLENDKDFNPNKQVFSSKVFTKKK